jgi:hypothetical protein
MDENYCEYLENLLTTLSYEEITNQIAIETNNNRIKKIYGTIKTNIELIIDISKLIFKNSKLSDDNIIDFINNSDLFEKHIIFIVLCIYRPNIAKSYFNENIWNLTDRILNFIGLNDRYEQIINFAYYYTAKYGNSSTLCWLELIYGPKINNVKTGSLEICCKTNNAGTFQYIFNNIWKSLNHKQINSLRHTAILNNSIKIIEIMKSSFLFRDVTQILEALYALTIQIHDSQYSEYFLELYRQYFDFLDDFQKDENLLELLDHSILESRQDLIVFLYNYSPNKINKYCENIFVSADKIHN